MEFIQLLIENIRKKNSRLVLGADPIWSELPTKIKADAINKYGNSVYAGSWAIGEYFKEIIPIVKDHVVAIKIQLAYFEIFGASGYQSYENLVREAQNSGLLVIADVKKGDIYSTSEAYAKAHIGTIIIKDDIELNVIGADAMTINPYMGRDAIIPFLLEAYKKQKGLFVLCRTPNPSASEIQDYSCNNIPLYKEIAKIINEISLPYLNKEIGYSMMGAVVLANNPKITSELRKDMPNTYFLMPGFGFQGGKVEDIGYAFHAGGLGAIINSSRDILYGKDDGEWQIKICERVKNIKNSINHIIL